jgi:hypothetical protein
MTPASSSRGSPKIQVDTMPAGKFFAYAAEILKLQPPHITDEPILAQMRRIGIERGKSFDIDKLDPAIKTALETAPKDALALMAWKVAGLARVANGWSMNTDTMGVYGNYYLKRAIVTQLGLGANPKPSPVDSSAVFRTRRRIFHVAQTRLGQPDGISPSRMAEMLEVAKARPKVRC